MLTEVRGLLPRADLLLLGFYGPYPALPGYPYAEFAGRAIRGLNEVVAGLAGKFGGFYVDTYTPFVGHEAEYTYMLQPDTLPGRNNIHPNAAGYTVIARQMQVVPELSGMMLTLIDVGALGVAGYGWRRRTGSWGPGATGSVCREPVPAGGWGKA